jgi:parallel beta-helix repeat protein
MTRRRATLVLVSTAAASLAILGHGQAGAASLTCSGLSSRNVPVSDAKTLKAALTNARPGDRIQLANGTYAGRFTLAVDGTSLQRIQLCGGPGAVLDGGAWTTGYGLTVRADNVDLVGFTVTNSQKGIVLDGSSYDVLDSLQVNEIGDEGIHLRSASHGDVVRNSTVTDTGLRMPEYGEGVYVGSAYNNWCTYSACGPDRSDSNTVTGNTFSRNGAEGVDVKEGTTGTVVSSNSFDGTGSSALSWVDVKGNDGLIVGNTGQVARRDGFLTEVGATGWGVRNTFAANVADVRGPGYAVNVRPGNTVTCTNVVVSAAKGLSNVACL